MEKLNKDFRSFIELLESEEVEYLVVGGYAVAWHGFPRYTGDIDFFVAIHEDNAARLLKVFERFGFGDIGLEKEDFLKESFVVEIGREPRKIQVLTGIDGVHFADCYSKSVEADVEGLRLRLIGKEDLLRNKAASGRAKDLIDLDELRKIP